MADEVTAQKHHRFDLICQNCHVGSLVVAIFEVIGHDTKAVFKGAVDLQKELFIRIRVVNHQLRANDFL